MSDFTVNIYIIDQDSENSARRRSQSRHTGQSEGEFTKQIR